MPNPMFLQVMGVKLSEYNTYSSAKKGRFQRTAQQKLAELHESDIDGYNKLTADTEKAKSANEVDAAAAAAEDEEFK